MQALVTIALWLLLFVNLGRFQEVFPALSPFQLGKVSIALSFATVMALNPKDITLFLTKTSFRNYLYALLILGFLGIPFSIYISDSLDKYIGLLRLFLSSSIIVALAYRKMRNLQLCFIVIMFVLSVQIFLQHTTGRSSVSSTYDPNDIALLFVMFLPFTINGVGSKNIIVKILSLVTAGSIIASIALSGSRGGLLALVSIALYSIILAKKHRFLYICLCSLGAIIFSQMASEELWLRIQAVFDGTDYNLSETGDSRMAIWTNAVRIMFTKPLFGVGIGQFITAMGTLTDGPWKTAHNSFIQIGLELGFGGLFAFCAIFYAFFRLSKQGEQAPFFSPHTQALYRSLRVSVLAFCVGGFFVSHAYSPITYSFISFGAVMFLEYQRQERRALENAKTLSSETPDNEFGGMPDEKPSKTKSNHQIPQQNARYANENNIEELIQYAKDHTTEAYIKKESAKSVKLTEAEQRRQRRKARLQSGDILKKLPKE